MSWHRIETDDDESKPGRLQTVFEIAFYAAGGPHDWALLKATDGSGRFFVSPAAVETLTSVVINYRAKPDEPPGLGQVELVVGHPQMVEKLLDPS